MNDFGLHPGLVWLLRRAPLLLFRSTRRRFKGVKGALLAIVLFVFLLVIAAPTIIQSIMMQEDAALMAARARKFAPLSLFAMTAMSMLAPAQRRGGLYFKPPEVGLLFPAPLSRKQLLAYHVLSRAQIQVLSALWVSIFVIRYAPTWYGCVLGLMCALLFLQLLSQALALLTAAAGKRLAAPVRWGVLTVAAIAVVMGGASAAAQLRIDNGIEAAFDALAAEPIVQIVTLPFVPFANTFAAESLLEAATWTGVCFAVLLLLVAVIARLDVAYEEAALDVSRNVRRSLERMRSGGGAMAVMGPSKKRFSVPRLPWLGGAGAVAWRQCVEISRNPRALVTSTLLLALWPAMMGATAYFTDPGEEGLQKAAVAVAATVGMFSVVWTQNISFDFRRDLDRMAFLRSLPLTPMAIAAGQVGPTSVLLAVMQFVVITPVIVVSGLLPLYAVPALFPIMLPLAWLVIALDNLLFLVLPHRIDPDDAGNVGFMGKMMLVMSLKFAALFAVLLVAGGVGFGVGYVLGKSYIAGTLVGLAIIGAVDVVLTFLVGRAYDAFDPGRDMPA